MYRLILGNIRVTVTDDSITREQATAAARQAIAAANQQGRLLSHIEMYATSDGIDVKISEKAGNRSSRKTLKQSLLDSMHAAVKEKLYPANAYHDDNVWFDSETGQEWHGESITETKDEILQSFKDWEASIK